MTSRVYLAGPIFNPEQLAVVQWLKDELEVSGVEVFSPWHNSQGIFKGRKPADCSADERAQVLTDNIKGLDWCDYLLAWVGGMGGFTDPGVIWEMGYVGKRSGSPAAYGRGAVLPMTIAYIDDSDDRQSMNLMLAGTVEAVVKGRDEFRRARLFLSDGEVAAIQAVWHPDLVLSADKQPVV